MSRVHLSLAVIAVGLALVLSGCGGSGKVKVEGVVTLDGTPVEGALVAFTPVSKTEGQVCQGTTDKDGKFRLTTTKPDDGALPGEYKVTVVYAEGAEPPPSQDVKGAFTGFEKAATQKLKPPKYNVPAKYQDPDQSGLKQKIPPAGKIEFALKSK
jgi:hypothetical protein